MNQKHEQNIFCVIVSVHVMVENVIQIKSKLKICVDASVKIQ